MKDLNHGKKAEEQGFEVYTSAEAAEKSRYYHDLNQR